jgi:hypothetical protein
VLLNVAEEPMLAESFGVVEIPTVIADRDRGDAELSLTAPPCEPTFSP